MFRRALKVGPVAATVAVMVASVSSAQQIDWPPTFTQPLNSAVEAMRLAPDAYARRAAFIAAQDPTMLAAAKAAPGGSLTLHMGNIQLSSEAVIADMAAVFEELGVADAGNLPQQALDLIVATSLLSEAGTTGVPPTPSAAHAVWEAIQRYDEVAELVGAPTLRELFTVALPGDAGERLNGALDRIEQVNEIFENLEDVAAGDTEAVDDFVTGVLGLLPAGASPALSGPASVAFVDVMQWNANMYDASADGLNLVADAIETGQIDQTRLNEITERLNNLSQGPWGGDTARDFVRSWCGLLPALGGLCEELFDEVAELIEGPVCARIDCDCANVGGGLLAGPDRVTCEINQADMRAFCEANNRIEGVCEPGGPNAFPR
jgi:hypothetical protein